MSSLSSWITRAALPLMSNRSFVKSIGKTALNSKKNALKFATRPGCGSERSLRMQRHPQQHVREFSSARAMSKIMAMAGDDVGRGPKTDSKVAIETSELKQFSREAMKKVMEEAKELSKRKPSVDHNLSTEGLKDRIKDGIALMQTGLVERDTEVRLLLLAALSGEHILYIGPPGTAKSELGRRLSSLCEGQFFERLLTRFSVPEELFGPLSMRALEEDQYIRQTDGYLPKATVAFIDEIFKANSAILNTLLTVLNERLFDNGSDREKVPLLCMVGASNELPESEELDALYDRFLIRKKVDQVSAGGLVDLLETAGNDPEGLRMNGVRPGDSNEQSAILTEKDFRVAREHAAKNVKVPREVINLLADLRTWLQEKCEPPVYVSDRRLVKAVALMQVAAFTDERDTVSQYDCLLLQHVFWSQPDESSRIYEWLLSQLVYDAGIQQVSYLLSGMFGRACKNLGDDEKIDELLDQMGQLRELLTDKLGSILQCVEGGFPMLLDHLWLPKDEAEAVVNALLPKLEKSRKAVEEALFEVVALEVALQQKVDAVLLATLMPKRWAEFIRNGPKDEVADLGVIKKTF